jgi:hypothetical protein
MIAADGLLQHEEVIITSLLGSAEKTAAGAGNAEPFPVPVVCCLP